MTMSFLPTQKFVAVPALPEWQFFKLPRHKTSCLKKATGFFQTSFCRRQFALIHIEQQWADNYFTVDGSLKHERVDDPFLTEKRGGLIVSRALPVRSETYGLSGTCDAVEFRASPDGVSLAGREGLWLPMPVEYKRGKSKETDADRHQLCAQALCLEEMLCCPPIPCGCLYYFETRRREEVPLTEELRGTVVSMLKEMRSLYDRGYTPKVKYSKKCTACSLKDICLPKLQRYPSATAYTAGIWKEDEPET